jgi:hypothetical protein
MDPFLVHAVAIVSRTSGDAGALLELLELLQAEAVHAELDDRSLRMKRPRNQCHWNEQRFGRGWRLLASRMTTLRHLRCPYRSCCNEVNGLLLERESGIIRR